MVTSGLRQFKTPSVGLKVALAALLCLMLFSVMPRSEDGGTESDIIQQLRHEADTAAIFEHNQPLARDLYLQDRNTNVVIYNRVPKCASTSTRSLLADLAKFNDIKVFTSKIYAKEVLNKTEQAAFAKDVLTMREVVDQPLVFVRHVFFVDFQRLGLPQPVYINVIRDPLERHVSDYYYKRYNLHSMFPMDDSKRRRTYNECVLGNHSECVADTNKGYFRIIPYFCGQHPKCFQASKWALERAKHNVETFYSTVGLVENLDQFLEVLQVLLPDHFSEAVNVYENNENRYRAMAKTAKKDSLTEEVRAIMIDKMTYDYQFYAFIKQRFHRQWQTLVNHADNVR